MSGITLGAHRVLTGETAAALAKKLRLSSSLAITEIPANKRHVPPLASLSELPVGVIVAIPPNAIDLCKERLYALHSVRPAFLDHFDRMQTLAEESLMPLAAETGLASNSEAVKSEIAVLDSFVADGIREITALAQPLLPICLGMVHTHVAQPADHAMVESASDPRCCMYWAVSPPILEFWSSMWTSGALSSKLFDAEPATEWLITTQHQNMVRSLVVQQIDQRIRDVQALHRRLLQETDI